MKFPTVIIFALLAFVSIAYAQDDLCTRLMKKCDMRIKGFQNSVATVWLGMPGVALTKKFVTGNNNGVIIGQVNLGDRPADFIYKNGVGPVTNKGFNKYSFKPFPSGNGTAIGRQWFNKQQMATARGKCVRVWFSHFQLYFPPTFELVNFKRSPPGSTDCIVFKFRK